MQGLAVRNTAALHALGIHLLEELVNLPRRQKGLIAAVLGCPLTFAQLLLGSVALTVYCSWKSTWSGGSLTEAV